MFEITIKEIRTEKKRVRGEWSVLGKRLVNAEDIQKSAYSEREEYKQKLLAGQVVMMEERGYAPDYEKDVESTVEILSQRVETLDLPTVIKAINNLT